MSKLLALPPPILDLIIEELFQGTICLSKERGTIMASFAKTCILARQVLSRNYMRWCNAMVHSRLTSKSWKDICEIIDPVPNRNGSTTIVRWETRVMPRERDISNPELAHHCMIFSPSSIVMEAVIMSSSSPGEEFPVVHLCPNLRYYQRNDSCKQDFAKWFQMFDSAKASYNSTTTRLCVKVDFQTDTISHCYDTKCTFFGKHGDPYPQCPILACQSKSIGPTNLVDPINNRITKSITVIISWKVGEPDLRICPADQL